MSERTKVYSPTPYEDELYTMREDGTEVRVAKCLDSDWASRFGMLHDASLNMDTEEAVALLTHGADLRDALVNALSDLRAFQTGTVDGHIKQRMEVYASELAKLEGN